MTILNNEAFPKVRASSINVLMLTPTLGAGGAERVFVSLIKHFLGVNVTAIITRFGDAPNDAGLVREARRHTKVIVTDSDDSFRSAISKESHRAHIVLSWGISDLADVRVPHVPFVDVSHTSHEWHAFNEASDRDAITGANFAIAVSSSARKAYPEKYRPQVEVIPNGIETSRTSPRLGRSVQRESWRIKKTTKVVLYMGRFNAEKRPMLTLEAIEELKKWNKTRRASDPRDFMLIAAGPESPWRTEFQQVAAKRLPDLVAFPQYETHVGDLLAAADCLCISSEFEAHPLVMLEAFHAGLPVVTTSFDSLDEPFVRNAEGATSYREFCWPVPINCSAEQLARAIESAVDERNSDRCLAAQRIVSSAYTADMMAATYERYLFGCVRDWLAASVFPPLAFNESESSQKKRGGAS